MTFLRNLHVRGKLLGMGVQSSRTGALLKNTIKLHFVFMFSHTRAKTISFAKLRQIGFCTQLPGMSRAKSLSIGVADKLNNIRNQWCDIAFAFAFRLVVGPYNIVKSQMAAGLKWPLIKFDDQHDNQ